MAIKDYRFDPFNNVINIKRITGESHQVPNQSPYTIRLNEVPQKTDPSSLSIKFASGELLTEVAALPSKGQYWPDYNTTAHGVEDWNTGTLLFNAADSGKIIHASYNGIGTLVDDRIQDMLQLPITTSVQSEREMIVDGKAASYDGTEEEGSPGRNTIGHNYVKIKQHRGLPAGTYTLRDVIQQLVNRSQTFEFVKGISHRNCHVDCNCDCSDDT